MLAQPLLNTKLKGSHSELRLANHMRLVSAHESLRHQHSLNLTRLHNLQSEHESAESERSAALFELEQLRSQNNGLQSACESFQHALTDLKAQRAELLAMFEDQKLSSEAERDTAQRSMARLMSQHSFHQKELQQVRNSQSARSTELVELKKVLEEALLELDAFKAQVQSNAGLEYEYEIILSKNARLCGEHELLLDDHQELSAEHAELNDIHEQLKSQHNQLEALLEQQCQKLSAHQHQHHNQLSDAEELQKVTLAELEDAKCAYSTDLHQLQDEVLSLEDELRHAKREHKIDRDADHKQLQQQFRQALEQQSEDHHKALKQLSEHNSSYKSDFEEQLKGLGAQNAALLHRFPRSQDGTSDLLKDVNDLKLSYSDSERQRERERCSQLELELDQSRESQFEVQSELARLQADLRKLHELAAGHRLTAEDLFHMFAKPVRSEGSLKKSSLPSATASTTAATAAVGNDHLQSSDIDQPSADGGSLFTDSAPEGLGSHTAAVPVPGATAEAAAVDPSSTADTAAPGNGKAGQSGSATDQAVDEPDSNWPAGESSGNMVHYYHNQQVSLAHTLVLLCSSVS